MKIKCIKLVNKYTGFSEISNGSVTVGKIYDVVYLHFDFGEQKKYCSNIQIAVDGDVKNDTSFIDNPEFFEIVDSSIPSNMGVFMDIKREHITVQPRAFEEYQSTLEEGTPFWNDFYEGERAAIELYRKEVAFIKGETYEPLPQGKPDAKELLEIYRRREQDGLIPNQGFNEAFEPTALTSTTEWRK